MNATDAEVVSDLANKFEAVMKAESRHVLDMAEVAGCGPRLEFELELRMIRFAVSHMRGRLMDLLGRPQGAAIPISVVALAAGSRSTRWVVPRRSSALPT